MSDKLIENAEGDIVSILPEQSMILTLEYPNASVERLGTSWRVTPTDSIMAERVGSVVNAWLALTGELTLTTSDETGYRVTLWLAGQEHPLKFWVQPNDLLVTDILAQKSWKINVTQLDTITVSSL